MVIRRRVLLAVDSRIPYKQTDVPVDVEAVSVQNSISIPFCIHFVYPTTI